VQAALWCLYTETCFLYNKSRHRQTSIKDVGLALFSQDYTQRLWLFLLQYVTKLVFRFSAQNMVKFQGIVYLRGNENSNSAKAEAVSQDLCICIGSAQFKTRQGTLSYNRSPIVPFILQKHARRIFSGKQRMPLSFLTLYPQSPSHHIRCSVTFAVQSSLSTQKTLKQISMFVGPCIIVITEE